MISLYLELFSTFNFVFKLPKNNQRSTRLMSLILFAFLPFFGFGQTTTQTNEENYVLVALKSGSGIWTVPACVEKIDQTNKAIDQMVYELYGLTDEEIAIVEGAT